MSQEQQPPAGKILRWVKASDPEAIDINIQVGDRIRIYGTETTVEGFYGSYNEGLERWETIILTTKRGDPFERSIEHIEVNADIEFVSPFRSAPAYPVEEKAEDLGRVKEELRLCIRERNKYLHQVDTLTESKPSPVIEIAGHPKPEDLPDTGNPLASYWFEKARLLLVDRNDFKGQLVRANEKIEQLTKASHPAPAPIVGEREEEGDFMDRARKGCDALIASTIAATGEGRDNIYVSEQGFWEAEKAFKKSPTEQALPEEIDKDWESRKIDRLAEVIGMSEDHIRELQSELSAANARIKELQEWYDSHQ